MFLPLLQLRGLQNEVGRALCHPVFVLSTTRGLWQPACQSTRRAAKGRLKTNLMEVVTGLIQISAPDHVVGATFQGHARFPERPVWLRPRPHTCVRIMSFHECSVGVFRSIHVTACENLIHACRIANYDLPCRPLDSMPGCSTCMSIVDLSEQVTRVIAGLVKVAAPDDGVHGRCHGIASPLGRTPSFFNRRDPCMVSMLLQELLMGVDTRLVEVPAPDDGIHC
mmetsp:Transcript_39312/g.98917  ORF Transcript_39312/g.98917 Transcript_39312/m.98917 type:complete len:224 (-) Transcript_39312:330-1001(-)